MCLPRPVAQRLQTVVKRVHLPQAGTAPPPSRPCMSACDWSRLQFSVMRGPFLADDEVQQLLERDLLSNPELAAAAARQKSPVTLAAPGLQCFHHAQLRPLSRNVIHAVPYV